MKVAKLGSVWSYATKGKKPHYIFVVAKEGFLQGIPTASEVYTKGGGCWPITSIDYHDDNLTDHTIKPYRGEYPKISRQLSLVASDYGLTLTDMEVHVPKCQCGELC